MIARWIATDPRFLMHHRGLKTRWKYQVIKRRTQAHREHPLRLPASAQFLKLYPRFAAMLNKLWQLTWHAHLGACLIDNAVSSSGGLIKYFQCFNANFDAYPWRGVANQAPRPSKRPPW